MAAKGQGKKPIAEAMIREGKTTEEIMAATGLRRGSVQHYRRSFIAQQGGQNPCRERMGMTVEEEQRVIDAARARLKLRAQLVAKSPGADLPLPGESALDRKRAEEAKMADAPLSEVFKLRVRPDAMNHTMRGL
ncbi:hypothetical protein [Sulfitobacter sp. 1A15106]|uniref:hypothetical protein n=1 Tax=Sulfitobacter sp. 1A15106 TaxID=3368590 RepID=UPI0037475B37